MSTTKPEPTAPDAFARLLRARASERTLDVEVSGTSMGATIVGGSTVAVAAGGVPRRGQIWAFVDDSGAFVVHRLRARGAGRYSFRGDGNGWRDPAVSGERLVGRVLRITGPDGQTRKVGLRLGPALGTVLLLRRAVDTALRAGRGPRPPVPPR